MLDVQDLSFSYGTEPILKHVGFQAQAGCVTSVIGPNGTGKTTMLLCIARLLPYSGAVFLDGTNLNLLSRQDFASLVSFLPQDTSCSAELNVYEVILLGLVNRLSFRVAQEDTERVRSVMELLGITKFADRRITELSGGQRQLVFIAQTLVKEPKLLILDEPTSALDLNRQVRLMDLIRRITRERNLTTLVTLHHLDIAAKYSDRVVTLDRGGIYRVGTPEETFTQGMFRDVFGIASQIYKDPLGGLHVIALGDLPEENGNESRPGGPDSNKRKGDEGQPML